MLAAVFVADDVATAADPPRVTQSFVIDTNGNPEAVTGQAAKTRAIFKRLGIDARRRYFQATMAGASTGSLALAIEYPSLAALAAAQEKLANDSEWQAYVDKLQGTVRSNRTRSGLKFPQSRCRMQNDAGEQSAPPRLRS